MDKKIDLEGIKKLYSSLETQKNIVLTRARDCAKLTIPELITDTGHTENTDLERPLQNIGEKGVNTISSKLMVALLPPNNPFFRLKFDQATILELEGNVELKTEMERALVKIEKTVVDYIETSSIRSSIDLVLKLLVVSGNALIYMPDDGGIRVFNLENFSVERDPFGNVKQIVTKETLMYQNLPKDIYDKVVLTLKEEDKKKNLDLYTRIYLNEENKWVLYQEVNDVIIQDTVEIYEKDNSPYIPLRWTSINNESYGRGLVLGIKGDLESIEELYSSILDITKLSAMTKFLVNPNSMTNIKKLSDSRNGDFIIGNVNDITTLQINKYNDLQVVISAMEDIKQRINSTFLTNQSIQRQAERVTAEEIRIMAQDIEKSLGGIYSVLSQELQLPLVRRIMKQLEVKNAIPKLPKDKISPQITTGLEALGRGYDLNKLNSFIQNIASLPGVIERLNLDELVKRIGNGYGIDMEGLIKPQEQIQAEQEAAQQNEMIQKSTPGIAQEVVKNTFK